MEAEARREWRGEGENRRSKERWPASTLVLCALAGFPALAGHWNTSTTVTPGGPPSGAPRVGVALSAGVLREEISAATAGEVGAGPGSADWPAGLLALIRGRFQDSLCIGCACGTAARAPRVAPQCTVQRFRYGAALTGVRPWLAASRQPEWPNRAQKQIWRWTRCSRECKAYIRACTLIHWCLS